MDSHSKGNKGLPKGVLLQAETATPNGAEIVSTPDVSISNKASTPQSYQIPRNYYLITRAYTETLGLDPVEEILLQRDFIID